MPHAFLCRPMLTSTNIDNVDARCREAARSSIKTGVNHVYALEVPVQLHKPEGAEMLSKFYTREPTRQHVNVQDFMLWRREYSFSLFIFLFFYLYFHFSLAAYDLIGSQLTPILSYIALIRQT